MSRLGKKPIAIPEKTEVSVSDSVVAVKGPHGELSRTMPRRISVEVSGSEVTVKPVKVTAGGEAADKESAALWGTVASHVSNMIAGVNEPYEKKLVVEGVGFKVDVQGKKLVMQLGFSHPVEVEVPEGLEVSADKNEITVKGINKEQVGKFAADVRALKKPEPYKGKGIRYSDEVIRRKQGKKAV